MCGVYTLYTFDFGSCDYSSYFFKKEERREVDGREEKTRREEVEEKRERKERKAERKGRRKKTEGRGTGESVFPVLLLWPSLHTAGLLPLPQWPLGWLRHTLSSPLPTLFGPHIGLCSPLVFSGPSVSQDLPFNSPYPSRDQPTMLKEK